MVIRWASAMGMSSFCDFSGAPSFLNTLTRSPEWWGAGPGDSALGWKPQKAQLAWGRDRGATRPVLPQVTRRTARMVAEWQCVGFCHGVLNTDNMSVVGLTIDYGPFGFLDR